MSDFFRNLAEDLKDEDTSIAADGMGSAEYTGTDASNAVDRVLHEKRYSLFLEGHRLSDMRHYDKTGELPLDRTDGDNPDTVVTFPIPETETPG